MEGRGGEGEREERKGVGEEGGPSCSVGAHKSEQGDYDGHGDTNTC